MATTGTKVPSIYKIPSKADPELKQFAESIKEAVEVRLGRRGDPRDRAITLRELIDSGLAKELTDNPFDPNAGVQSIDFEPQTVTDYTIPPTPTGFTATAAYTSFTLAWDNPQMSNLAYTEVWRHTSNDVTSATRIDTTSAFVWSEEVGYNKTYWYWIRHVSTSDIIGQFSTSSGSAHTGTTSVDIGAVMSSLSETLADLPGYSSLQTADNAVEIIQGTGVPDNNTNRADGTDPHAGDLYLRTSNQQLYIRNTANNAWIECSDDSVVQVIGSTSYTGASLTAAIATAQSDLSSQATSITNLTSTVNAKGDIYRASSAPSGGTYVTGDLWVDTDDNQLYQWNGSAWVTARDTGVATSTQLNSVSSTANSNASSITTLQTTTTNLANDASAAYVLQVNANGSVAGMVIEANAYGASDNSGSAVQFRADKFAIWNATGTDTGSAGVAPFIVDGGVVYIDTARIKDASIAAAKIVSLSADLVNAVAINATSISAGTLSADRIGANSITGGKIAADTLSIDGVAIGGSIGTINGTTVADASIYEYSEIYLSAWNTTGRRHVADTTQSTGSDSGETGSIPAITADSSILGNSPIMTFTFTTFDWGSGTRKHLFLFAGNIKGSAAGSGYRVEGALAFVCKATTSATDYTSTSGYVFSTGKTMSGDTAVIGSQVLSEQADLNPNTQYYVWLFGGVDDISNEGLYDSSITVLGLNK